MSNQRITVVHKDGSLTAEPMTERLLYELRRHGQLRPEQLRQHLKEIGCLNEAKVQLFERLLTQPLQN